MEKYFKQIGISDFKIFLELWESLFLKNFTERIWNELREKTIVKKCIMIALSIFMLHYCLILFGLCELCAKREVTSCFTFVFGGKIAKSFWAMIFGLRTRLVYHKGERRNKESGNLGNFFSHSWLDISTKI